MDAEFFINKTFDAGLKTVFETIFASSNTIINGAAGEVLVGKKDGVHLGMNGKVVFHRTLG